jgi:hypothetical protein
MAAKDDAETPPADLIGVGKSGRAQFRDDGRADVPLRPEEIAVHPALTSSMGAGTEVLRVLQA